MTGPDWLNRWERASYWSGEWMGEVIEHRPDLTASRTDSGHHDQEVPTCPESSSPSPSSERP